MKEENIQFLECIADELIDAGVNFYFQDKRWMDEADDIDVNVAEESLDIFDSIMKKYNFVFRNSIHPNYLFYTKFSKGEFLKIHVQIGNYEGLPTDVLDPHDISKSGSYYLPKEEQIFFFVYRIALGESLEKYQRYLEDFVFEKVDKGHLLFLLDKVFRNPEDILSNVLNKDFSNLSFEFTFFHNLSRAKMFMLNQGIRTIRHFLNIGSKGVHIAVIGADGSGKTTAIQDSSEMLDKNDISWDYISGRRFTFQVLPLNWIFDVAEEKYSEKIKEDSKHARRYPSPFVKLITPFIYYLEYFLRALLKTRPIKKEYEVVLSDRSFIDVIASPNTFTLIAKILYKLLPKPDVTIYLYNDLDTLDNRRPQHPRYDLMRQMKVYNSLNNYYKYQIKTDDRDVVSEYIFTVILSQN